MAYRKAYDGIFIHSAIRTVADAGIENTRTKDVAARAGYCEATMFRHFPTKEILLRETFLYVEKQLIGILTKSAPAGAPEEMGLHEVWYRVYRYLVNHREETIFLIRYRCSSLYTEDVRSRSPIRRGGSDEVYKALEAYFGPVSRARAELLLDAAFELTLSFAGKIADGRLEDGPETEQTVRLAVSGVLETLSRGSERVLNDEEREETNDAECRSAG